MRYNTDMKHLYLMRAENGLTKIGITTDIARRLRGIETQSPVSVEVIFCAYIEDAAILESRILSQFRSKCHHADWYDLSRNDVNTIRTLVDEPSANINTEHEAPALFVDSLGRKRITVTCQACGRRSFVKSNRHFLCKHCKSTVFKEKVQ